MRRSATAVVHDAIPGFGGLPALPCSGDLAARCAKGLELTVAQTARFCQVFADDQLTSTVRSGRTGGRAQRRGTIAASRLGLLHHAAEALVRRAIAGRDARPNVLSSPRHVGGVGAQVWLRIGVDRYSCRCCSRLRYRGRSAGRWRRCADSGARRWWGSNRSLSAVRRGGRRRTCRRRPWSVVWCRCAPPGVRIIAVPRGCRLGGGRGLGWGRGLGALGPRAVAVRSWCHGGGRASPSRVSVPLVGLNQSTGGGRAFGRACVDVWGARWLLSRASELVRFVTAQVGLQASEGLTTDTPVGPDMVAPLERLDGGSRLRAEQSVLFERWVCAGCVERLLNRSDVFAAMATTHHRAVAIDVGERRRAPVAGSQWDFEEGVVRSRRRRDQNHRRGYRLVLRRVSRLFSNGYRSCVGVARRGFEVAARGSKAPLQMPSRHRGL